MKNLDALISLLNSNNVKIDAIELAESLWLSKYISKTEPIKSFNINDNPTINPTEQPNLIEEPPESPTNSTVKQLQKQKRKDVPLHPISDKEKKNSLPFRTPLVRRLYRDNDLIFSFRHFRQKILSLKKGKLDEEKIADHMTKTDIFRPFYQKSYEKRFRVVFIVDSSESMNVWENLIDAFVNDVKNYHIFKEVKVYYLSSDHSKLKLYKKKSLISAIHEKWYKVLDQNSVVFMFSDMLSIAWSSGELLHKISHWQNYSPFVVVQMLPQRLWNGTKLIDASMGKMNGQKKFGLNCQLLSRAEDILKMEEEVLPKFIKLPLLNFTEKSIDAYGKVMCSLPKSYIEGALFEIEDFKGEYQSTQKQITLKAEQRLRGFYKYASTQAKALLELLAVVPLSLPIIKLVQQKLLPQSTQEHLSEIFMSSIIDKEQKVDGFYQFSKLEHGENGVREELIKKIGARKAFETINRLSEVVKRHGGVFDFLSFVVDPDSLKSTHEFNEIDREFARISVVVLHEMGGKYHNFASRLEEKDEINKDLLAIIKWADSYNIPVNQLPRDEDKLFSIDTLKLQSNDIDRLPKEMGILINLKVLDIGYNKIIEVPEFIGNLINLEELYMRDNKILKLPENIGNLTSLVKLYIGMNKIKKLPNSMKNLENLISLEVGNNQLTELFDSIGNLKKLRDLWIENNKIKDLPSSINNLLFLSKDSKYKIKRFNVKGGLLESFFEDYTEIILWIEKNNLYHVPKNNEGLKNLISLDISDAFIKDLPHSIGKLKNLKILDISHNSIETLPESIGDLNKLRSLNISFNDIKKLPYSINKLFLLSQDSKEKIKHFPVDKRGFKKSFFEDYGEIISWANKYNISQKKLPRNNESLMKLTVLDISNCGINELPSSFYKLINLSSLNLSNNNLTSLPLTVSKLENLTKLDISFNNINKFDKYKDEFLELYNNGYKKLNQLRITGNPLTELSKNLKYSTSLHIIYTHKNQLIYLPDYKYINTYEKDMEYLYVEKIQEESTGILTFLKKIFF